MFRLILVEFKRLFSSKLFLALFLISIIGLNYTNRPNKYNDTSRELNQEFLSEYLEMDTVTYIETKYESDMLAIETELNAVYQEICPSVLANEDFRSREWMCNDESGRLLSQEDEYKELFAKYNFLQNLRYQVVFLDEEGLMQYGCDQTGTGEYCPDFIKDALAEGKKFVLQNYGGMSEEQGQYLVQEYGEDHWLVKGFYDALEVNKQERDIYILESYTIGYPSWYDSTPIVATLFITLITAVILFTNDKVYKFDELSFTTKRGRKVSLAKLIVLVSLAFVTTLLLPVLIHYRQLIAGGFDILKDYKANEVQLNYSAGMYWSDITIGNVEYLKMLYMILITTTFSLLIGTIARITRGYISMLVVSGAFIASPIILTLINQLIWRLNFVSFPYQLINYFSPIGNMNSISRFLSFSEGIYLKNIEFISIGIWLLIAVVITFVVYLFHLTREDIKT